MVGASMKKIVGDLTGARVVDRLSGSIGTHLAAIMNGADIIRVHDTKALSQSINTFFAISKCC